MIGKVILAWESVCIRILSLAHCTSSLHWMRFCQSFALVCRGSFYTDDLVLITDAQEECISKLKVWKAGMESNMLRDNMKKSEVLVSDVIMIC